MNLPYNGGETASDPGGYQTRKARYERQSPDTRSHTEAKQHNDPKSARSQPPTRHYQAAPQTTVNHPPNPHNREYQTGEPTQPGRPRDDYSYNNDTRSKGSQKLGPKHGDKKPNSQNLRRTQTTRGNNNTNQFTQSNENVNDDDHSKRQYYNYKSGNREHCFKGGQSGHTRYSNYHYNNTNTSHEQATHFQDSTEPQDNPTNGAWAPNSQERPPPRDIPPHPRDNQQSHFEYYSQRTTNPQEGSYTRDNYQDHQWDDPSQHQTDYCNHQTPQGSHSLSEQTHNELETLDTAANELHRLASGVGSHEC